MLKGGFLNRLFCGIIITTCAPVAQLNRVSVSEAEGHGFDSRRAQVVFKVDKEMLCDL